MRRLIIKLTSIATLTLIVATATMAQGPLASNSGQVVLNGRAGAFVEVRAGGAASLTNAVGGSISATKAKGDLLGGMTIDMGELGAMNTASFVKATVPLRLRSNRAYTLSLGATSFTNSNADAIQMSDIAVGVANVSRTDPGVKAGTDTIASGLNGDPSTITTDANPGTPRWNWPAARRLSGFTTSSAILSGSSIMKAQPNNANGLTLNTFFVVKPQSFAESTFSTTITYTITTP